MEVSYQLHTSAAEHLYLEEPSASLDIEDLKDLLPFLGLKILDEVNSRVQARPLEAQANC
jgi:hypothetical protein